MGRRRIIPTAGSRVFMHARTPICAMTGCNRRKEHRARALCNRCEDTATFLQKLREKYPKPKRRYHSSAGIEARYRAGRTS